jgi:hypothetical protein
MARNEQWQTRLPDDISEQLHDYREERDIAKSETLRRAAESFANDVSTDESDTDESVNVPSGPAMADGFGRVTRPFLSSILTGAVLYPFAVMTLLFAGYVGIGVFVGSVLAGIALAAAVGIVLATDAPERADRRAAVWGAKQAERVRNAL